MRTTLILSALALAVLALAGCATLPPGMTDRYPSSPLRYTRPEAQPIQQVEIGTVVDVRSVAIQTGSTRAAVGSGVGALAGGLLSHQVGGGNGKTLATVAGAVAGAIGGDPAAAPPGKPPRPALPRPLPPRGGGRPTGEGTPARAPGGRVQPGDRVEVVGTGCYGGSYCQSPARVIPMPAGGSR